MSNVEKRLAKKSLRLPNPPEPLGNFSLAQIFGNLVYVSGHGPLQADGHYMTGKVPGTCSVDAAYNAARLTGMGALASLKATIGDLDRVVQVVKVLGMVNADPRFTEHPKVINGFSDLMVEAFGEVGRAARSAVGVGSLPGDIPVEVEMVVEIK